MVRPAVVCPTLPSQPWRWTATHHKLLRQPADACALQTPSTFALSELTRENLIMKTTLLRCAMLLAVVTSLPAAAQHDERCEPVPKAEWRPQAELKRKLTNQGWKISRVKVTNGCYEVYGRDEKNAKAEQFFHPRTLERVTAAK